MQTQLSPEFKDTDDGHAAEAILRKCVHCGLCNATCPTYQVAGDERDGPRGRIYLIKQVLEGGPASPITQRHLDRCLTCRNCETTCPAGVEYGTLLDIGRRLVDERVGRPAPERARRWLLREGLTSPWFRPAVSLGRALAPWLPRSLAAPLAGAARPPSGAFPARPHARRMLMLTGCVQPALRPSIGLATARVLDAALIQTIRVPSAGCCGAVRAHLGDEQGARADMRRNIDAWWPALAGHDAEAIVIDGSACALMVKSYGAALDDDPAYREKAARVSALARDVSELLPELIPSLAGRVRQGAAGTLTFHPPCTLQHGQRLRNGVEPHLRTLGFDVTVPPEDAHLCCGSAGTYSVLQPAMARELRARKVAALEARGPATIISANIGCIQHLQAGTEIPVRHWIEVLADSLS